MSITLKEIAGLAGVSVSTVSLVLNNKPCRISQSTKDNINAIAGEYNYKPNVIARSLVTKETKTLGLIVPDIGNIFFSTLVKSLELNCRREGYTLIIVNSDENSKEDFSLIDLLIARGVDGLFLIISNETYLHKDKLIDKLDNLDIPFIMIDRIYDDYECNKVYSDNYEGTNKAIKYLIEAGHTKIACLSHSIAVKNTLSRLNGYLHAMESYEIKVPPEYILLGDYTPQSGYDACEHLLATDATAILVCNDMMALGLMKHLYERGYKVPDSYSIISYDNQLSSYQLDVSITSLDQNIKQLGYHACDLMMQKLHSSKDKTQPLKICLEPELIIRNSVKFY